MGVFGHNAICPQVKTVPLSGALDGLNQPTTASFPAEKWLTVETSERQRMGVSDDVVALAGFSLGC
jgi:hypothetical protein